MYRTMTAVYGSTIAFVLIAALLLSGCGKTSGRVFSAWGCGIRTVVNFVGLTNEKTAPCGNDVIAGLRFEPPQGWESRVTFLLFGHAWTNGSADPKTAEMLWLDRVEAINEEPSPTKGLANVTKRRIVLCGHQPAQYTSGDAIRANIAPKLAFFRLMTKIAPGTDYSIEEMRTTIGRWLYTATYWRPMGTTADPRAERALRSLCPAR